MPVRRLIDDKNSPQGPLFYNEAWGLYDFVRDFKLF